MVVTCDTGTQYSLDDISVNIQLEPSCLISTPKKIPADVPSAEPPSPSPSTVSSPVKPSSDYKPSILDAAEEANEESSDE